ncbi:MAG TPA: AraC family transcriptional regulator [Gemmatimonadota bacterium]|nr:AraC family transcriptional regulator [Gemmatimonadota bacterium]
MDCRLPDGRFFGTTLRSRRSGEITVSEVEFPARAEVPPHSHGKPIFNFILSGGYTEYWGRRSLDCRGPLLLFHPSEIVHSERFSACGARCLTLEFDPAWIERVGEDGPVLGDNAAFPPGAWIWVAVRLREELRARDDLSAFVIEGFLQILLAAAGRRSRSVPDRRPSPAIERARELLHARYAERLRIAAVAAEAGLHPTYLARAFRRYYGATPGEYARRLRVDEACRQLADPGGSLSRIATAVGFADQSHFTRVFRRMTGMTPAGYRERILTR